MLFFFFFFFFFFVFFFCFFFKKLTLLSQNCSDSFWFSKTNQVIHSPAKFQGPSSHNYQDIFLTRIAGWTDGRTNGPKAICPSNFFEAGGINKTNACIQFDQLHQSLWSFPLIILRKRPLYILGIVVCNSCISRETVNRSPVHGYTVNLYM